MTDYTIAVVQDALHLLDSFCQEQKGLTLTEIVEKTGLGKNKVFRILYTLEQSRMVYRDGNHKFHLGFRLAELAHNVHQHDLLLDVSETVMDDLLEATQESIFLGVASGHNALCIAARESTRSMRLYARVGILSPLYMGGVPKVLLAYMNLKQREKHLKHFEKTVTAEDIDWGEFREKLATIRQQGHAITKDELDLGAHSVTAPVFDSSGRTIAGMSIAGPSVRFDENTIAGYVHLVREATLYVSAKLGYNPQHESSVARQEQILSK